MNKESIYRLIGYHGKYDDHVKKALRKLLKEYHPDRHGDEKVFKLINEVKKELETNHVTFKYDKNQKNEINDDIDYEYCNEKILELEIKRGDILHRINMQREKKVKNLQKYTDLYANILDEKMRINNMESFKNINRLKNEIMYMVIIWIIFFILFLLLNKTFFLYVMIPMGFTTIFLILKFKKVSFTMPKINNLYTAKYSKLDKELKKIVLENDLIKEQENKLSIELNHVENDLRFYNNILKYQNKKGK